MIPYLPDGVYADLRTASNIRFQLQIKDLHEFKIGLIVGSIYIFLNIRRYTVSPDAKSGILIQKEAPLPEDILTLGIDGLNQIWRDAKLRGSWKGRGKDLIRLQAQCRKQRKCQYLQEWKSECFGGL